MTNNSYIWIALLLGVQGACSSTSDDTTRRPTTPEAGRNSSGSDRTRTGQGQIEAETTPNNSPPSTGPASSDPPPPQTPPPAGARGAMNASARDAFQQGLNAARAGQLETARAAFESALSSDPRAYQAAYNAGVIAERQGQDPAAEILYQRSLSIQADYDLAVVARTRLLIRTRRLPEAISFVGGIARSNSGNFSVRAEYARLLVLNNRAQDAIDEARQILRADERNVGAKLAVAEAYRALGRLDLALYIVNDLINGSDPNHPNNGPGANVSTVQHLRGLLQLEVERNVPAAIISFRRAVELDPEFAEARNNLGVQFLLAGNYQEAIEQLQAATALSPAWSKAHLNLGDALRATGQYDRAMAEFQRAQQLEPGLVEVHYNSGRLYAEQARSIAGSEVESLQRKVQLLQQAQAAFTRYREALGAAYTSNVRRDDVEAQLTRLPQQIERAQRSLQRAQRATQRSGTPANDPAPSTPASAAATDPQNTPPASPTNTTSAISTVTTPNTPPTLSASAPAATQAGTTQPSAGISTPYDDPANDAASSPNR